MTTTADTNRYRAYAVTPEGDVLEYSTNRAGEQQRHPGSGETGTSQFLARSDREFRRLLREWLGLEYAVFAFRSECTQIAAQRRLRWLLWRDGVNASIAIGHRRAEQEKGQPSNGASTYAITMQALDDLQQGLALTR